MEPCPLYQSSDLKPSYRLRYGWTGWPMQGTTLPGGIEDAMARTDAAWQTDHLRRLEWNLSPEQVQITFSAMPDVSPVFFAARVKGRLQHAMRAAGTPVEFSRKVAVRSIGENTRADVENYIASQVDRAELADPAFREALREFTVVDPTVDLSQPTETRSGRYWYNLHVVLVTAGRWRTGDRRWLGKVRDQTQRIAAKKGWRISVLSVMPDHLHAAMRGDIEQSPEQIALALLNNLAYALGQICVWQPGYYAGTFSEYDMGAVRQARR